MRPHEPIRSHDLLTAHVPRLAAQAPLGMKTRPRAVSSLSALFSFALLPLSGGQPYGAYNVSTPWADLLTTYSSGFGSMPIAASSSHVFASSATSNNIYAISVSTGAPLGGWPINAANTMPACLNNTFGTSQGLAVDSFGNLFVADKQNGCVLKITPGGSVSLPYVAGSPIFVAPVGVAVSSSGTVYVIDSATNCISTFLVGGAVTNLTCSAPTSATGIALGPDGSIFISTASDINLLTPSTNYSLPGTPFFSANASSISAIGTDSVGNVYFVNALLHCIQEQSFSRELSDLAGKCASSTLPRADGIGTTANFVFPRGIAVYPDGQTLFVTDFGTSMQRVSIRKLVYIPYPPPPPTPPLPSPAPPKLPPPPLPVQSSVPPPFPQLLLLPPSTPPHTPQQ